MTQSRTYYYRRMHDAYNGTLPDSAEVARRLANEKKILSILDAVRASRTGAKSVVTSLRKILAAVAHAELSDWQEPIRAASGSKAADVNALVSVQDVRLLRAVDELLSAHSSRTLLEHLSWWLLQRLTVIGWPQAYDVIAGSETAAKHAVKLDCYELAATRFALLFASESAVQLFSVETRHRAEAFLRELISDMADIAGKAAWLSDKAKAAVRKTLLEIEVVLWPPDLAASNATLWELYSNLGVSDEPANNMVAGGSGSPPSPLSSTESLTLFDQWRHASDGFRRLPAAKRERMQLLWQNDELSPFFFDRWNRRLRVSQAALLSPLYRPDSEEVRDADYGGLGAAFLLHVLRAFEEPAADVDDGMLPRLDYGAVAQKARDLKCGAHFLANLREVAALGIAWHAMKKRDAATTGRHVPAAAATTTDERGRVHAYTSDQLFFLAHCRSRCRGHLPRESLRGKDCNVAVRHVRGFAEAFGCVRGSPMAPANECVASDIL
ncbi:uncharacterized protein LOC142559630 [Dermacentor variabilis]|uniref:uncharacterized protein LOC142559630 n=1 Tax=Dermacentor variabilis TaxID=34621 RepID=UPI003F5C4A3D